MTTLYKPVLIESAEQAEALPIGTIAVDPDQGAATRVAYGLGWSITGDSDSDQHEHLVGWTALVPIEAEEETSTSPVQLQDAVNRMIARANQAAVTGVLPLDRLEIQQQTRYVTPWEEQS